MEDHNSAPFLPVLCLLLCAAVPLPDAMGVVALAEEEELGDETQRRQKTGDREKWNDMAIIFGAPR